MSSQRSGEQVPEHPIVILCRNRHDQDIAGTAEFHRNMDHPVIARVDKHRYGIPRNAMT
jgi:hypothetical protein